MEILFTLRSLLLTLFIALAILPGHAQVSGDFQTKNNIGYWGNSNSWNRYNGATWIAAIAGQLPNVTSDVFVQADHIISIDNESAVCDNLYVNGNSASKISFAPPTGVLNIKGDMSLFSTSHNCFDNWAAGAKIVFSGTGSQGVINLSKNAEFVNLEINKSSGTFNSGGSVVSIKDTMFLTSGIFNIGEEGSLVLKNGVMVSVDGKLEGTKTSDLTITGFAADTMLLPLEGNISLRNIIISGTRVIKMDGENDINLSGIFAIDSFATYDNGGESRIINNGGSISISGKFITKDARGFIGSGAAIPTIIPVLNAGCIIEYGRMADQDVQSSPAYVNVTFSGSGFKTPSNAFYPKGTVYITGSAILNASTNNIGDSATNLTMDGGRLIVGTTGPQPKMQGFYNITGGTIQFGGSAQSIRSRAYQNIEVTGTDVRNSSGNITLNDAGTFSVKPGGVFSINSDAITGPSGGQTVTIENGGLFRTGNNKGFNGFASAFSEFSSIHKNIENINLAPGSTVEYVRNGDQPITNFNNLIYSNLVISGTGDKTAPQDVLTINGNLLNTGTAIFVHNTGTVLFSNSTASQNYNSAAPGFTFYNLKDSATGGNGLLVNSEMSIAGTLTISTSSKLKVDGNITLISNPAATASVAELPESALMSYGTGIFIVERYFTPKRAWRFLSVPTNTLQSVKEAWQEEAVSTTENPIAGYGTQITDKFTPDSINGFDYYSSGPSIKKYDPVNNKWIGISGTNIPVASKEGLMTFVRGDRSANNLYAPVSPTVLRTKGLLNTGTQEDVIVIPQQFTSLGNPYASAVDMRKILTTNVDKTFYIWDPKLTGTGFGAYQTFTLMDKDYFPTPGSGSYGDPSLPYNYIQSGQAFFVYNSTPENGSVSFSENAKASADSPLVNNNLVFRPAEQPSIQFLRTTLYRINTNQTGDVLDGVLTIFGTDYSDTTDKEDALKATNFGENLAIKNAENKMLSVEKRSAVNDNDTIRLNLTNVRSGDFKFRVKATNFNKDGLVAYLEDKYANTLTPIVNDSAIYNFKIMEEAASQNPDRFIIVFKATSVPLPVTFTSLKAYQQNSSIMVQWNVENEKNIKEYVVEKSLDGQKFNSINTSKAKGNHSVANSYFWLDKNAVTGNNYYRIRSINLTGGIQYTAVVNVLSGHRKPQILITPNPMVANMIILQFINQPKGDYTINLQTISGSILSTFNKTHQQGSSSETIPINNLLPKGIYLLNIKGDGREFSLKLVK